MPRHPDTHAQPPRSGPAASDLRSRALTSHLPGVVYRVRNDREWTSEFVSEGSTALTGYTPAEFVGGTVNFGDLTHPDDREWVWEVVQGALDDRRPYEMTFRLRTRDGGEKWVWEQGQGIYDDAGGLVALEGLIIDVTDRVRAEEELRSSAAQMAAVASASAGILGTRTPVELADVLRKACARVLPFDALLFGIYDPDREVLTYAGGWDDGVYVEPGLEVPAAGTPSARVIATGAPLRTSTSDDPAGQGAMVTGRPRRSESTIRVPVFDESDSVMGVLSIQSYRPNLYDEADVRAAEVFAAVAASALRNIALLDELGASRRRLEESERYFRSLIENASEVTTVLDAEGIIRYESPAVERLVGRPPEAMIGLDAFRSVHPDDLGRVREAFDRLLELPGGTLRTEFRIRDAGNAWRHLSVTGTNLLEDPAVRGVVINSRDETARREAEDSLRESEARYRQFFDDDLTGDFITTFYGTIIDCNAAFARFLGFDDPLELIGESIVPFYHQARDRDRMVAELRLHDRIEGHEKAMRDRHGREVFGIFNTIAERDGEGRIRQVRGYVFDITERKNLEAQLRQAQKMEAIGRLAGGVAHDFNNILTAVLGNAQLLLEQTPAGDPGRSDLEEIESAALRAGELTKQLLAFSRQQTLQPRTLDLNETIRGLGNLFHRLIGDRISIRLEMADELPPVVADPAQMEQVVMNLAINARDAMEDGGTLTFRTGTREVSETDRADHPALRPGRYVAIEVEDTGMGMKESVLAKIFEPFYTTKDIGKGTGLGLSTVFGIVRQSDGFVRVESEPGRGSLFTVLIPVGEERVGERRPRGERSSGASVGTIVLAEDEVAIRTLARRSLVRAGYRVLEAASADEMLRRVDESGGRIDLLLTDVLMPGPPIEEVVRDLTTRYPGLRVVYMSGYSRDELAEHGRTDPERTFLQKPFGPDELVAAVQAALEETSR